MNHSDNFKYIKPRRLSPISRNSRVTSLGTGSLKLGEVNPNFSDETSTGDNHFKWPWTRSRRMAVSENSSSLINRDLSLIPVVDTSSSIVSVFQSIPVSRDLDEKCLGSRPAYTRCNHCQEYIVTKTESTVGVFACLSSSIICLFG